MSSQDADADFELLAVDDRLVASETRYEIIDGELVYVPPSPEPQARGKAKLVALLEAHVADDFDCAIDMLTRTSPTDDFAPDASVYPIARDPRTGGRQLEHLAFEVVTTRSLVDSNRKATKLVGRGVRRVFAIDVEGVHAFEWSTDLGTWSLLDADAMIQDRALAAPLPIGALLGAVDSDVAIFDALSAKGNPVAVAYARERARAAGSAEGTATAIVQVLLARGLALSADDRARILAERDPVRLDHWVERAMTCESVADLLAVD